MKARTLNPAKARRAAAAADRPGEACKGAAKTWVPTVDRARCEGKGDCVEVCPVGVFDVRRIDDADYRALPWTNRFKVLVHGMNSAYVVAPDACQACGLCVVACPEHAITLGKRAPHAE